LLPRRNLAKIRTSELFNELLSPNLYDVQQSRRVLTERGKSIVGDLRKWTARQTDPKALLQALWIYQSIDVRNDGLLDKVLQAPDGRIRAAAVRVLSYWPRTHLASAGPDKGLPVPADCYERALADSFPRVRVEALRAIATIPSLRSAKLALDTLNRPMDSFLDYTLWLTINDLAKPWLDGLLSGAWSIEGRQKELDFAANAIQPELLSAALNKILKIQPLTRDGARPWIELIGRAGLPEDVDQLYRKLLENGFKPFAAARAGAALNEAAISRSVRPKSDLDKIVKFFGASDQDTRIEAIRLAGNWGGPGVSFSNLVVLAGNVKTAPPVRDAVFEALKKTGGQKTIEALQPLTGKNEAPQIRRPAVLTLAALDVNHCGSNAVSLLSGLTNEEAALPVWRALLGCTGAGPVLAGALPFYGFPRAVGKAGLRAVRESGQNEPELVVALTRAAGLQGKETALTDAEVKKLGEAVLKSGDASRGERIFRRPQQSCTSCHSIGGVGGKVGPDLTSLGASAPIDYLINSVLYPNKDIKDGYQSYLIETTDGEDLTGIPVRENDRELVIRTATGQEVTVLKKQIKRKKAGGSLMPSGLADSLTGQEQLDLYRFLSDLGKPGLFDASKGNVARLWEVSLDPAQSADEKKLLDSTLTGESWHRATSLVNGRLLGDDLETAAQSGKKSTNATVLAGTLFRSVKTGPVRFKLSAPDGTSTWIDGKPVEHTNSLTADLPDGVHTIIVKLEGKEIPDAIRLQSDDGTFLGN
jgi:putative heme-binding domain-containing protein